MNPPPSPARLFLRLALTLLLLMSGIGGVQAAGTWTPLANTAPGGVSLMLLLTDGTVMVQNGGGNAWYKLTPDSSGSYINGTWTTLASMHEYPPVRSHRMSSRPARSLSPAENTAPAAATPKFIIHSPTPGRKRPPPR